MEGPSLIRNYHKMGKRKGAYPASSEVAAAGDPNPSVRLVLALLLLLVIIAIAFVVWRRARNRGLHYEELESVELTRGKNAEDERTPARTPPREDSPAARTAAAAAAPPTPEQEAPRPVAREAPPVQYGPLELRRREGAGAVHCWQTLHPSEFEVRGANYLRDGKRLPSDQTSSLLAVELFHAADTMYNVAGRPGAPTASLAERATEHPIRSVLVVNLVIPAQEGVYQLVFYFGVWAGDEGSGHATLLERFCSGSDAFRNARFKLLPNVSEGSWLVKNGVGSTPAVLGKTLRQRFHRGESYFEVDVDCNSSPAAGRVVSLVKSYSKSLVVDLAFVIEAQSVAELPERVIGCGRLARIELTEDRIPSFEAHSAV